MTSDSVRAPRCDQGAARAHETGISNRRARVPLRWCGPRSVVTTWRDPRRRQRSRGRTSLSGKSSPNAFRSFISDNRAECLHLPQYAP
jgi:hypothetical protein